MATSKGGKPGPLDAFWDTYSGPSTTSGTMSDLLRSLPGGPSSVTKGLQKKERPAERQEPKDDPILLLVRVLHRTEGQELPIVEILKQTRIGPSDIMAVIDQAMDLGLVELNTNNPRTKTYRLTPGGQDFVQGTAA